ncbi:Lsr2 family protein [Streptomyces sp. NPDC088360]|uniref:histone-like nucleoid-structuring protein Lsr2 n=1 Tax=Streptomyces sp. NPDC088360 TaxID=3154515 RepID=UPI00344F15DE
MKKTIVTLIDDLDPTEQTTADETVTFALDGVHYEIDLSTDNAHRLRAGLKEFKQAARVLKTTTKRSPRTPAPAGDTSSSRSDAEAINAWAIEKGLREPGKRGRLPNSIKEAYTASQAGDDAPLHELRALIRVVKSTTTVEQRDHSAAPKAVAAAEAKQPADPQEAEAREHYRAIQRSERMADEAKWKRRTGYGNERTDKIEDWTLTERIEGLSEQHLSILGRLAGVLPLAKGNNVSHLKTSEKRLENLEFIEQDLTSPHGWAITDFGRYAYEVHSMG